MKFRNLMLGITNTGGENQVGCGIDPFSFTTIASVCMGIFRFMHLEDTYEIRLKENEDVEEWLVGQKKGNSNLRVSKQGEWFEVEEEEVLEKKFVESPIGLIPSGGYGNGDNFSKVSIQWLEWESKVWGVDIKHA